MKKIIGIALLAGGIVMLVFGYQAKGSLESKLNEALEGAPTNRVTWYLVGGAVCSAAGIGLIMLKDKAKEKK
jgi:energy-converting hydrogenase Eha subunit C